MKITCERGFYKFYPESPNELVIFGDLYGVELVPMGDFYTYPALASLPDYSIQGQLFGGIEAVVNFAGKPWEVFMQNRLKYDPEKGIIRKNQPQGKVGENPTNYIWLVVGIPQAYAELNDKTIISGFTGWLNVVKNYSIIARWENASV